MKFFFWIAFLCLAALTIPPASSLQAEEANGAPDPFYLETRDSDTPEQAKKKAALRLFTTYAVLITRGKDCQGKSGDMATELAQYEKRNGNTLAETFKVVQSLGGITPEIKAAVDKKILEDIYEASGQNCQTLSDEIRDGKYDLYKAPDLADDYKLMRADN